MAESRRIGRRWRKELNVLIDMGHPAHVHFFRTAIRILQGLGHRVVVTASDKDVTLSLLRAYRIPFRARGRNVRSKIGKALAMPGISFRIARIGAENRVGILAGINNPYVAQASRLLGIPSVVFDDTESARLINAATFRFASLICTPRRFAKDLGRKQLKYDGFHELAYLHPKYFKADSRVPAALSPDGQPYVLVRLVAGRASHDSARITSRLDSALAAGGLGQLERVARVYIVGENALPEYLAGHQYPLAPETVLDALAGCAAYVGDGATMATEAALLGRPSIYVSPLRFGGMLELERRFGLLRMMRDPAEAIGQAVSWVQDATWEDSWRERRADLLASTIDVTALLVEILSDPSSVVRFRGRTLGG